MRPFPAITTIIAALATVLVVRAAHLHAEPPGAQKQSMQAMRWFVPGPPGSPPDLAARIVAEPLSSALGHPIVIENRPGAGGTIALAAVAKSAPDGYTLGLLGTNHVIAPAVFKQMPYDTTKDLAPIVQLVVSDTVMVARGSFPLATVHAVVVSARRNPGLMKYSSAGNSTPSHLAGELFRINAGIDVNHIPYKGPGEAMSAVLGEQVDFSFIGIATVAPHIRSGKLRALAVAAPRRLAAHPDVPTMNEAGYPGIEVQPWLGIVAPAGTPKRVIARLAATFATLLASPPLKERFATVGMNTVENVGPEEFAMVIKLDLSRWAKVIREAGIRAD